MSEPKSKRLADDERKRLVDEYRLLSAKMRVLQKEHGGEWTSGFKKMRTRIKAIERLLYS